MSFLHLKIEDLVGENRVGRGDVLRPAGPRELRIPLFIVCSNTRPGFKNKVSVGSYLDDLGRESCDQLVFSDVFPLAIEFLFPDHVELGVVERIVAVDSRERLDPSGEAVLLLRLESLEGGRDTGFPDDDLDKIMNVTDEVPLE